MSTLGTEGASSAACRATRSFKTHGWWLDLKTPLFLVVDRHGYNVSPKLAGEVFSQAQASAKHVVWFEESAHGG